MIDGIDDASLVGSDDGGSEGAPECKEVGKTDANIDGIEEG